ncbi:MAG: hypothetical protein R3B72_02525 [Polyangiaceae bacterium]
MRRVALACFLSALATTSLGCVDPDLGSEVQAIYVVPGSLDELAGDSWLDHPWPSNLRRVDGSPVFAGFPNPKGVAILEEYVTASEGMLDGFSPVVGGYFRFAGAIDPESLPADPVASMGERSSVILVDVDPASPEFGQAHPIETSFRAEAGVYTQDNTLRWMPALGFPLRPQTTYAIAVTHHLQSFDGGAIAASPDLLEVLGEAEPRGATAALAEEYATALDMLESHGARRSALRQLAVFTTSDPTAETRAVAKHLHENVPAPDFITRDPWRVFPETGYVEYRAEYGPSPNYQAGTLPFSVYGDGGSFNFVDGSPEVVDTFDARFSLTVPNDPACPMPPAGYPIVLYAHGTGGSFKSYLSSGIAEDLAKECIASMGVDQIFHGTRPGAPPTTTGIELLFFNFQNVEAARTNGRQSAIDEVQRARLFTERQAVIPAAVSHTGEDIRFDPDKVMFMGHSQGGLNGPLYLAVDDSARGGVLSGSGAVIAITLLEKTSPTPSIADLVPTVFLALIGDEERAELDIFHPAMMLAQSLVDAIDPINYARLTVRDPLPGHSSKSVLMTEGIAPDGTGDSYTPPRGTEAQAVAMGLPVQEPVQHPYPQLDWGAPGPITVPPEGLVGNLAGGAASGALAQWAPEGGDGHFVVFDVAAARAQAIAFLKALAADPVGRLPAP